MYAFGKPADITIVGRTGDRIVSCAQAKLVNSNVNIDIISNTRTRDSWHTNKSVLIYRMVINARQKSSVTSTTSDRYVYKGEEIWK